MDTGWATARTLRIVANNLFGRQCSDMSPTSTARTRNREKVSASRSCIEFDLCDTAASAIIQGRAHELLANSSAAMFLRDEHHADPGQILAVCDRCNSANQFAGARCGETPAWTKSQKSLPITLGLVHCSLSSSCNAAGRSALNECI